MKAKYSSSSLLLPGILLCTLHTLAHLSLQQNYDQTFPAQRFTHTGVPIQADVRTHRNILGAVDASVPTAY